MTIIYVLAGIGAGTVVCTAAVIVLFGRELAASDREYRRHIDALREHVTTTGIPTR